MMSSFLALSVISDSFAFSGNGMFSHEFTRGCLAFVNPTEEGKVHK
jgi:hypothetical protein